MSEIEEKNLEKVEFTALDKGLSDAVALSNQQLLGGLSDLDKNVVKLNKEISTRATIGTVLKIIVVVSGVVIATGFLTNWNWVIQVIGGFISLITAVERIFGNVDVLLSKVAGRDAYSRIRREIVNKHEAKIIDIVQVRDTTPIEAAKEYIKVQSEIRDQIYKVDNDIKTNIENKNYELLGRLTLEDTKKQ
jgi:hypothetical protein